MRSMAVAAQKAEPTSAKKYVYRTQDSEFTNTHTLSHRIEHICMYAN